MRSIKLRLWILLFSFMIMPLMQNCSPADIGASSASSDSALGTTPAVDTKSYHQLMQTTNGELFISRNISTSTTTRYVTHRCSTDNGATWKQIYLTEELKTNFYRAGSGFEYHSQGSRADLSLIYQKDDQIYFYALGCAANKKDLLYTMTVNLSDMITGLDQSGDIVRVSLVSGYGTPQQQTRVMIVDLNNQTEALLNPPASRTFVYGPWIHNNTIIAYVTASGGATNYELVQSSNNGATWSAPQIFPRTTTGYSSVQFDRGLYYSVFGTSVFLSLDGINWTSQDYPTEEHGGTFFGFQTYQMQSRTFFCAAKGIYEVNGDLSTRFIKRSTNNRGCGGWSYGFLFEKNNELYTHHNTANDNPNFQIDFVEAL